LYRMVKPERLVKNGRAREIGIKITARRGW
jgi:hypothetical protein